MSSHPVVLLNLLLEQMKQNSRLSVTDTQDLDHLYAQALDISKRNIWPDAKIITFDCCPNVVMSDESEPTEIFDNDSPWPEIKL